MEHKSLFLRDLIYFHYFVVFNRQNAWFQAISDGQNFYCYIIQISQIAVFLFLFPYSTATNTWSKYAQERGWTITDEYIDDGYSGTNFDRPEVQRLLEDAKTGKIDTIIVKDLSRFGRNYIFVGQYVDYIFPMYNIRFIAISDNVDTANTNSAGMDMMPIMNVFNEWHSANTSKKIRAVAEANAKAV